MASDKKVKQKKFLEAYAQGSSISASARIAGVERMTVYNWKERDTEFARAFDDAYEQGNDRIDDEILRRAVDGYQVPMVSMGKVVYDSEGNVLTETKYSDSLIAFLAKSRMPKYREKQQVELTGKDGGAIKVDATDYTQFSNEELALLEQMAQKIQHGNT